MKGVFFCSASGPECYVTAICVDLTVTSRPARRSLVDNSIQQWLSVYNRNREGGLALNASRGWQMLQSVQRWPKQLLRFCSLGSWTVTDAEIYVVFLSFTFTVLACTQDAMLLEEIQLRRKTRGHFKCRWSVIIFHPGPFLGFKTRLASFKCVTRMSNGVPADLLPL